MNWADWAIIAVLGLSALISLVRGFVKEAMSLLIWLAAAVIASIFHDELASWMEQLITTPSLRMLTAWVALLGTGLRGRERWVTAAFGVRGIGSLYYLAFAAGSAQVPAIAELWLVVLSSIALSALVHGLSAGAALSGIRADRAAGAPEGAEA